MDEIKAQKLPLAEIQFFADYPGDYTVKVDKNGGYTVINHTGLGSRVIKQDIKG